MRWEFGTVLRQKQFFSKLKKILLCLQCASLCIQALLEMFSVFPFRQLDEIPWNPEITYHWEVLGRQRAQSE